ncbi:MAG: GMC family oxidoreductase [Geodermatophilaceae bacterium]|nr:GMC family oxidoreductase [Geodermatophilaceae bacterium]
MAAPHYDVLVLGSGFGGSVAALRLTEKGYRVGVLEAGRRFDESSFPKTSWDVRNFLWAPRLGCFGIQRISLLRNALILSGAGVGGGSLNYANTLYEPPNAFYTDPQWSHIADWNAELRPYYDQAQRMLGVTTNPVTTAADEVLRGVAEDLGVGHTYRPTPVGVFFGSPGIEVDDPYFGGAGPRRSGCLNCGACMTGCRHNAKNTLTKNYLHLAESAGAQVHPLTTVTSLRRGRPGGGDAGFEIETVRTGRWVNQARQTFTADQVVLAAGALGSAKLLHRMRDSGALPNLSPRLGVLTRTNSEAIIGARTWAVDADFSRGVAITSSIHPDANTHIEPVRYGKGSDAMGLLQTALADGDQRGPRLLAWLRELIRLRGKALDVHNPKGWAEKTIILLVMQTLDNSITTFTKRGLFGRRLSSRQGHGAPNPSWIPAGHDVARRVAKRIDGVPGGAWNDVANIPMTAHFIGGAAIGDSAKTGVIDPYHRVYGYPDMSVVDGAAISANLGVNPSLTITAQAERAMAMWPNRGEPDARSAPGAPYVPVVAVPPTKPAVPPSAPAALRLSITPI